MSRSPWNFKEGPTYIHVGPEVVKLTEDGYQRDDLTRLEQVIDSPLFTEGICGDGAAILMDGVMVPIERVIQLLNDSVVYRNGLLTCITHHHTIAGSMNVNSTIITICKTALRGYRC